MSKHAVVGALLTIGTVLAAGGVAFAHIDPDPLAMQAGITGTVEFKVEHGCNGSPTTSVKFQIPDGVTDAAAVDKAGWTASLTGNVLEYRGGPLAPDQEDHFDITLTAPTQPGEYRFPIIQTCQQGELAWIEVAAEGAPEPEHPAPTLKVTAGPPTSTDLTPGPEATDRGPTATSPVVIAPAPSTTAPAKADSSNTGTVVAVVIGVVVVLAGGSYLIARRRSASQPR